MGTLTRVVGIWQGRGLWPSFCKFQGGKCILAAEETEGTAFAKAQGKVGPEPVGNLGGKTWVQTHMVGRLVLGQEGGASLGSCPI